MFGDNQLNKDEIPLKVFENHLMAINYHINTGDNFFDLSDNEYFKAKLNKTVEPDYNRIKKILYNSWSTELALINTSHNSDIEYQKFSLHWCFPQVYYSVFLSTSAFFLAKNINIGNGHINLLKEFSLKVKQNCYPKCISFYCTGAFNDYNYHNIKSYESKNSLSYKDNSLLSAEIQIAQFLKTTRDLLLKKRKLDRQGSKNAITSLGKVKSNYNKADWISLSKNQWETTIMDLLYRLRIKANYEEIDTFIASEYSVTEIINQLILITNKLNFINECYLARLIGFKKYKEILEKFPSISEENPSMIRYTEHIIKNK